MNGKWFCDTNSTSVSSILCNNTKLARGFPNSPFSISYCGNWNATCFLYPLRIPIALLIMQQEEEMLDKNREAYESENAELGEIETRKTCDSKEVPHFIQ